jgi:hypothetical protein
MPTEYTAKHIQILRLAYCAERHYLLAFRGGKLRTSYHYMERVRDHRRGGSQRWYRLPRRRNRFLLYVGGESDDKEGAGPKSRAEYHQGKGTYTDLGRKETHSVGRPHKRRPYKGPRL